MIAPMTTPDGEYLTVAEVDGEWALESTLKADLEMLLRVAGDGHILLVCAASETFNARIAAFLSQRCRQLTIVATPTQMLHSGTPVDPDIIRGRRGREGQLVLAPGKVWRLARRRFALVILLTHGRRLLLSDLLSFLFIGRRRFFLAEHGDDGARLIAVHRHQARLLGRAATHCIDVLFSTVLLLLLVSYAAILRGLRR
ncbi:hypothetical protein JW905_13705 [bacterium]|nr:hypothetical protein [candidate division CSSED10-310 bacterium]